MIVVSDTSPISYLCRIGHIEILPAIYGQVVLPSAVARELSSEGAPTSVREFIATPPPWLEIQEPSRPNVVIGNIGAGEQSAIALAIELHADYVIADDLAAREAANRTNIRVIGTLGVLKLAGSRGLLQFDAAINDLQLSGFYISDKLKAEMLADQSGDSPI